MLRVSLYFSAHYRMCVGHGEGKVLPDAAGQYFSQVSDWECQPYNVTYLSGAEPHLVECLEKWVCVAPDETRHCLACVELCGGGVEQILEHLQELWALKYRVDTHLYKNNIM